SPQLVRWQDKAGFGRFSNRRITFPTLILQLQALNRHHIAVGIQLGYSMVFRRPATIDVISEYFLASFVVDFENDVFAKIFQRDILISRAALLIVSGHVVVVPHFVGPLLEYDVMRHATLQRDGLVFALARHAARRGRVASGTV